MFSVIQLNYIECVKNVEFIYIYFLSYGLLDFILEFRLVWEILFLPEKLQDSSKLVSPFM